MKLSIDVYIIQIQINEFIICIYKYKYENETVWYHN